MMKSKKTGYVYDPLFLKHNWPGHPEHKGRLQAIYNQLHQEKMLEKIQRIPARPATEEEILLVHTQQYLNQIKISQGWLDGDTYYSIGGGKDPDLKRSLDLVNWEYMGSLMHEDFPPGLGVTRYDDVSCPNMFRISNKWMLLCISHALGCRYYIGEFRDGKFLPESHALMNWEDVIFFVGQPGKCLFSHPSF